MQLHIQLSGRVVELSALAVPSEFSQEGLAPWLSKWKSLSQVRISEQNFGLLCSSRRPHGSTVVGIRIEVTLESLLLIWILFVLGTRLCIFPGFQ